MCRYSDVQFEEVCSHSPFCVLQGPEAPKIKTCQEVFSVLVLIDVHLIAPS